MRRLQQREWLKLITPGCVRLWPFSRHLCCSTSPQCSWQKYHHVLQWRTRIHPLSPGTRRCGGCSRVLHLYSSCLCWGCTCRDGNQRRGGESNLIKLQWQYQLLLRKSWVGTKKKKPICFHSKLACFKCFLCMQLCVFEKCTHTQKYSSCFDICVNVLQCFLSTWAIKVAFSSEVETQTTQSSTSY